MLGDRRVGAHVRVDDPRLPGDARLSGSRRCRPARAPAAGRATPTIWRARAAGTRRPGDTPAAPARWPATPSTRARSVDAADLDAALTMIDVALRLRRLRGRRPGAPAGTASRADRGRATASEVEEPAGLQVLDRPARARRHVLLHREPPVRLAHGRAARRGAVPRRARSRTPAGRARGTPPTGSSWRRVDAPQARSADSASSTPMPTSPSTRLRCARSSSSPPTSRSASSPRRCSTRSLLTLAAQLLARRARGGARSVLRADPALAALRGDRADHVGAVGYWALNTAVLPATALSTAAALPGARRRAGDRHRPARRSGTAARSTAASTASTTTCSIGPYGSDLRVWRTPDAMLSSVQDYRSGLPGLQEHIWGATLSLRGAGVRHQPGRRQQQLLGPAERLGGPAGAAAGAPAPRYGARAASLPAGDWPGRPTCGSRRR